MVIYYPAKFEMVTDNIHGEYNVTFRDLPDAQTSGYNLLDALHKASDCLKLVITDYMERGEKLPLPSDRYDYELNITAKV